MEKFESDYPIINVTVDIVVFRNRGAEFLVIKRGAEPFAGKWALPGGFMEPDETAREAARRELREETGVDIPGGFFVPVEARTAVDRDPRGRTISLPFYVLPNQIEVEKIEKGLKAGDDAVEVAWYPTNKVIEDYPETELAFDHNEIIKGIVRG